MRADILEDLLELQIDGGLDGVAVRAAMPLQPVPQEPRLADAPPAEHDDEPSVCGGAIQLGQLPFTIYKRRHTISLTHYDFI